MLIKIEYSSHILRKFFINAVLLRNPSSSVETQPYSKHLVFLCKMKFRANQMPYTILLNLLLIDFSNAAKILGIFPSPGKSHFGTNQAIMKSLIDAGHEVTVITSLPEYTKNVNYTAVMDVSEDAIKLAGKYSLWDTTRAPTYLVLCIAGMQLEGPLCDKVFRMKIFQDMLKNKGKRYDVAFVEMYILQNCFLPVAKKLGIPIIGTVTHKSWLYADKIITNPNNPSYVPSSTVPSWKVNDFYQKLVNVKDYLELQCVWYFVAVPKLKDFYNRNLQDIMFYSEFINIEPDFTFYNSHATYLPKPQNPNIAEIGGIHIQPAKPLPPNIQKFIDEAEHGVILISFGTGVKTSGMTNEMLTAFIEAIAQKPQRVIWKFDSDRGKFKIPDNLLLLEWLPQRDILEHKNVIAFMSHCGPGGVYEAIHTAKPVIAWPVQYDQGGNAALLEQLEVAVHLDIHLLTRDSFLEAFEAIVQDKKYYNNMQKFSECFKDRPMTPQESVVYWTEYVIKHKGAPHLKPASTMLHWFQYFLLDVMVFALLVLIFLIYIVYRIFKGICRITKQFRCEGDICEKKSQ